MAGAPKRYLNELKKLPSSLPPYVLAVPDDQNVLELHFILAYMPPTDDAPARAAYQHGIYWFKMTFPPDYPYRAPNIMSLTPNGRFRAGMNICVSETMFQQSSMNSALSVAAMILSFAGFMQDDTQPGHVGHYTNVTAAVRMEFALGSVQFNLANATFRRMFPGIAADPDASRAWILSQKTADEVPDAAPAEAARAPKRERSPDPELVAALAEAARAPDPAPAVDSIPFAPLTWLAQGGAGGAGSAAALFVNTEQYRAAADAGLRIGTQLAELATNIDALVAAGNEAEVYNVLQSVGRAKSVLKQTLGTIQKATHERILRRSIPAAPASRAAAIDFPVPLYAHQRSVLPQLLALDRAGGGVLADPPGFGKTFMIAALIYATLADTRGHTVIVAQKRLHAGWKTALNAFQIPGGRYRLVSTGPGAVSDNVTDGDVIRLVWDEAHLAKTGRWFNSRRSTWLVTGTPTQAVMNYPYSDPPVWQRVIRRTLSENTAVLPVTLEADMVVPPFLREARTLRARMGIISRALDTLREFEFRGWRAIETTVMNLGDAFLHGDISAWEARANLAQPVAGGTPSARLVNNVPGAAAHVASWLEICDRSSSGVCSVCHEGIDDTARPGVLFEKCKHLVCAECFDRMYTRADRPFCGLPCGQSKIADCYLLSVLRAHVKLSASKAAADAGDGVASAASAADAHHSLGSKGAAVLALVDHVRARGERIAVVVRSGDAAIALRHALRARDIPVDAILAGTSGDAIDALSARIEAGVSTSVLVAQEVAITVGLNLQHYHWVALTSPAPDLPQLIQLGSRFVRPGASVREVRFVHMHTRGAGERVLSVRARAGGARKIEPAELVQMLREEIE